jgi:hypothetical protein
MTGKAQKLPKVFYTNQMKGFNKNGKYERAKLRIGK